MKLTTYLLQLVFLTGVGSFATSDESVTKKLDAMCGPRVFVQGSFEKEPGVVSPDRKKRIALAKETNLRVDWGDKLLGTISIEELNAGLFVKWAPDSTAFFVMWSNGGSIGGYDARFFRVSATGLEEVHPARFASSEFAKKYYCQQRGNNLFAVKWGKDAKEILLFTQVYPTSDCGKNLGKSAGFLVSFPDGLVLKRYSDSQIEKIADSCRPLIWPTAFLNVEDLEKVEKEYARAKTH